MRKAGFYWVKYAGQWIVAEWTGNGPMGYWYMCGDEGGKIDEELDQMKETRLAEPEKVPERTTVVSVINQMGGQIGR